MNGQYDRIWGRFTAADPYEASAGAGDPGSWNRYAYVQGDPVNYNDPAGLLKVSPYYWLDCSETSAGYTCVMRLGMSASPADTVSSNGAASKIAGHALRDRIKKKNALIECETLAAFLEEVAEAMPWNSSGFVSSLVAITPQSGTPGWLFSFGRVSYTTATGAQFGGGKDSPDNGYKIHFKDSYGADEPLFGNNADQSHHFAAFFQLGWSRGSMVGSMAGFAFGPNTLGDGNLAYFAATLGATLRAGKIKPNDVAGIVMRELCEHGQP